jgi:ketosteroid isomerase-like protein
MEDEMTSTEAEVRAMIDSRSEAIRAKDLDLLMSFYSADVVYFDVVPPLRYAGSAALRARFTDWFAGYQGPIGQDVRDLSIASSGDVAVAHMLIRSGGTLINGAEVGLWVRATSTCQRSQGRWLVTHEHVSLPVDIATRSAAIDLVP